MMVLSNLTAQTLQPGQAVTFDKVILWTGNCECYSSQLPRSAKLKARGGVYSLGFSGNVASPTAGAAMQLAIAIGGQPLVETAMNSTPSTANVLNNISTETRFGNTCCDADRVSVINTGAVPVILAPNSALVIERRG